MKLDKFSIKWKIFLYIAAFIAVMLIVLWLFQTVFLDSFYKSIKLNSIKSSANTLAINIDAENFEELIKRMAHDNSMCVLIVSESGKTQYSADILPDCVIHHMPLSNIESFIKTAEENKGSHIIRFKRESFIDKGYNKNGFKGRVPTADQGMSESMVYVKSVASQSGEKYYIILNSTISPVEATVETLRIQLFIITGILLILAFGLAFLISNKIAKPVMVINESAKKLSQGDYNVKFNGYGYREIGELNNTLNKAAYELSKVESLRRELIANVSHDLRTPLTMITGFAEVMRDLPGENNPENAQVIIDESNRLNRLVTDLLDLSKIQSGADNLSLSRFSITDIIREIILRISKFMGGERVSFVPSESVYIEADEVKISQVIYNLTANAITHSGGVVEIKQTVKDQWVLIEVSDNGLGIPEKDIPFIWERYYKVDKTHTRAQVGSGLGLSIVKGILERHGANYGVKSSEGKGSTFWFEIKRT